MQLQFVGKNIEVTPALKNFTIEKMAPLNKRFNQVTTVNVVFHIEHDSHIAEATVHYNGTEIHARAQDIDMYNAIGMMVDKLLGQMTRHKEKIIDGHQQGGNIEL